jgi:hypothetical protein
MPPDEAALATAQSGDPPLRQASDADYYRHLAAEIVAMLPYVRADAFEVMALVEQMLNLEAAAQPPPPGEPPPPPAAA